MTFNRWWFLFVVLFLPLLLFRPLFAQPAIVETNSLATQQQLLSSPDASTRIEAIWKLREIKDPHAVEMLRPLLKDPESKVRRSVAIVLGILGGTQAMDGLISLLNDTDGEVVDVAIAELVNVGEPAASVLVEQIESPDAGIRAGALAVIGQVGEPRVSDAIIHLCHDTDARVRANAIAALAQFHDFRAEAQAETGMTDPDAQVRASAVFAFGRLNSPRSSQFATRALRDADARVRLNAVTVLGRLAPDNMVDLLLPLLTDANVDVRSEAARVLTTYRDPRLVDAYIAAMIDPALSQSAMKALGVLRDARAVTPLIALLRFEGRDKRIAEANRETTLNALILIGLPAVDALIAVLHDPNMQVRLCAAQALGAIGDRRALLPLQEAARDAEPKMRIAAVTALGLLGDVEAEPVLINALKDTDPAVGSAAARALCGTQNPAALDPLLELVDDANQNEQFLERRKQAIETLAEMDDPRAVARMLKVITDWRRQETFNLGTPGKGYLRDPRMLERLINEITDYNNYFTRFAYDAWSAAADAGMVPQLLSYLHDPRAEVRSLAAGVLNKFSDPAITPALLSLLDDPEMRGSVEMVLVTRTDRALLPEFIKRLTHKDVDVREMATEALGLYGTEQSDRIAKMLQDPEPNVRWAAARALVKVKDPRTAPALCAALKDSDYTTCLEVLRALAMIGDPRAIEPLFAMFKDTGQGERPGFLSLMGKFKDERTFSMLMQRLQDKQDPNRASAAGALGEVGDARAVDLLLATLVEPFTGDPMVPIRQLETAREPYNHLRDCVIKSLSEIGKRRVIEPLLAMLDQEMKQTTDTSTKEALIEALGRLHEPRALNLILQAVRDRQNEPKWDPTTCVVALKALGNSKAVLPLLQIRRITPTYQNQRTEAVEEALGSFKDATSKRLLLDALLGDQWRLRATAARALGYRKERWAITPLIARLADAQPQVRDAAADALKSLTGQAFGIDAGKWQAWLMAHPAGK